MKKTNLLEMTKKVLAVIGTAAIALFAKNTESNFMSIVSIVVKILSIVSGTVICGKKIRKRGALVGIVTALVYWVACIGISLFIEPLQFSLKMFMDLLFTLLIGAFAGILTVNALK